MILWVEPLKTKPGKEVLKALTAIFDRSGYPKKLRNDSGGEFSFSGLTKFLKNKNIYQHFALNSIMKANYAERVILTLKHNSNFFLNWNRLQGFFLSFRFEKLCK
jgi:hypothetical protein